MHLLVIVAFVLFLIALLARLNRDYYILSLCKRIKTVDGSPLEGKVFVIPGKTIFGNSFDVLKTDGEISFQLCRKWIEYSKGKSFLLHFFFTAVYNITNAEDAEEIFQSQSIIKKSKIYNFLEPFLGEGLLMSTDEKWHFRRRILTPAFHFNILQSFLEIFKEESQKFVEKLKNSQSDILSVSDAIPAFTLNTVCETALGVKLDDVEGGKIYRKSIHDFEKLILKVLFNPFMYFKLIFYLFGEYKAQMKVIKNIHDFSNKIIQKRREGFQQFMETQETQKDNFGRKKRYAMLDTLLTAEMEGQIDNTGICDEVNTFMFEGYDTTSMCLIFTLLHLALHQDIQEKCYNEIQHLDDLENLSLFDFNKLEYLECVLKEVLRLYPSVPFIARDCVNSTQVNGLTIPGGTQINVHIYDIMRDPRHFPEPSKFDPDRFLPENTTKRHPFAFVPFSAGPRNCIGQKFAILEMKVLLVSILKNFVLLPETRLEDLVLVNGIVLRTKQKVKVRVSKRVTAQSTA